MSDNERILEQNLDRRLRAFEDANPDRPDAQERHDLILQIIALEEKLNFA